jgi:hypothetical protein
MSLPPVHPQTVKVASLPAVEKDTDLANAWILAAVVGGLLTLYSLSRIISLQRRVRDLEAKPPVDDIVMRGLIRHEVSEIVSELETSIRAKQAFSKQDSFPKIPDPFEQPLRAEAVRAEPARSEPVRFEPNILEPLKAEPVKKEPVKVEQPEEREFKEEQLDSPPPSSNPSPSVPSKKRVVSKKKIEL